MYRLTAVLVATSALSLIFLGLFLPAPPAQGWRVPDASPQATGLEIFMSATEGGPRQTNFLSDTSRVRAVIAYEGAVNEQYMVRLRDLSGIAVFSRQFAALNGTGQVSVGITADDFIDSYKRNADDQGTPLQEDIGLAAGWCTNIPSVPDPWPPQPQPTPGPGPTPPPDPYLGWSEAMLNALEGARSATTELTRTLQAMLTLPDLATEMPAVHNDVAAARQQLTEANALLVAVPQLLRPAPPPSPTPGPGQPTPTSEPPPRPDPQIACQQVTQAKATIVDALAKIQTVVAALPAAPSNWRLPPTSARYAGGSFVGCLQYRTDLVEVVGGQPRDTAADSALWTVGDPSFPALMFPGLELVDPSNLGLLGLSLPEGHNAIYARKVLVPNVNHGAQLTAFVTDDNCIPVDQTSVTLWADTKTAGGATVKPGLVDLEDGAAEAALEAGDEATGFWGNTPPDPPELGSWVFGCVGPGCQPGQPPPPPGQVTPGQVWGRTRFEIIGMAHVSNTRLIINPRQINRLVDQTAGISLQVHDRNGRNVAAGTLARVWIKDGDPGFLAFDRQQLVGGRPSGSTERRVLGKTADLVVGENGQSRVPPSDDPGYVNLPRLYAYAGDGDDGSVTVCYDVDDATDCWADALTIVAETNIYLPLAFQRFDVRAQPTFLPPGADDGVRIR